MKKITFIFLGLLFSLNSMSQSTCTDSFSVSGLDDDPAILTINSSDITCNGANVATSLQLVNPSGNLTNNFCSVWYDFTLAVTGGDNDGFTVTGCASELDGIDLTGFTSLTITSTDLDAFSDGITITIDVEVTFPTPDCTSPVATVTVDENCPTFNLDVDITSLGDATSVTLSNDAGVASTTGISSTGIVTVGPFTEGTSVVLTLEHDQDTNCTVVLGDYSDACPPENDECANAEAIVCGGQYIGNTTNANPENPDPGSCGTTAGSGGAVWYKFTGQNSNDSGAVLGSLGDEISLDLSLSTFDTKIRVFEGTCDALICVDGNDDGGTGTTSLLTLPTIVGTEYYVLVHGFSNNAGLYTLDVTCTPPPSCPDPTALNATNITVDSADLEWVIGSTETLWDIELVDITASDVATGSPTATGVSNPYTANSLISNNEYEFYVRADCLGDGTSLWVGPFTFTTSCLATTTFPSSTDFTDNVPNSCWDEAGSGEFDSVPGDIGASSWKGGRAYTDDMEVVVNSNVMNLFLGDTAREWLISPTYNIPLDESYGLEVTVAVTDYRSSGTSASTDTDTMGSDDEVKLLITTDNGATWTALTTWNIGNQPAVTGTKFLADLTAISGDVRFAIWASDGLTNDTEDYDFHVGGFTVDTLSALGTNEFISDTSDLSYYPNPVNDILTINSKTNITSIEVLNLLGQKVKALKNSSVFVNLDMSDLSQGAYFVKIVSGGLIQTIRIIKK